MVKYAIVYSLVFFTLFALHAEEPQKQDFDNFLTLKKEWIKTSVKRFGESNYIAKAYAYDAYEINGRYRNYVDGFGYYIEQIVPSENLMLHKFFIPNNFRKSNIDSTLQLIYQDVCKRNSLPRADGLPAGYMTVLNSYRWFQSAGPFSRYHKKYSFTLKAVELDVNSPIYIIEYNLDKPIGPNFKVNKGLIYYNILSNEITRIYEDNAYLFSYLFHSYKNGTIEYDISFNEENGKYYFSKIEGSISHNMINEYIGISIVDDNFKYVDVSGHYSALFKFTNCPFIIYDEGFWSDKTNIYCDFDKVYKDMNSPHLLSNQFLNNHQSNYMTYLRDAENYDLEIDNKTYMELINYFEVLLNK